MSRLLILTVALVGLAGCSEKDLREVYEIVNASAEEIPLSRDEVTAALKDSLARGISKGGAIASAKNGYLDHPQLRIDFPPDVERIERALRDLGFDDEVVRFVRQLNRAAEKAGQLNHWADHSLALGSVSQLATGDPPHRSRGCPAYAMGVAELIRALLLLESGRVG